VKLSAEVPDSPDVDARPKKKSIIEGKEGIFIKGEKKNEMIPFSNPSSSTSTDTINASSPDSDDESGNSSNQLGSSSNPNSGSNQSNNTNNNAISAKQDPMRKTSNSKEKVDVKQVKDKKSVEPANDEDKEKCIIS